MPGAGLANVHMTSRFGAGRAGQFVESRSMRICAAYGGVWTHFARRCSTFLKT